MHVLNDTGHGLAFQIKQLEESRERHAAAVAEIDHLLGRIGEAINSVHPSSPMASAKAIGNGSATWNARLGNASSLLLEGGRRKYHKMERTGDQSVVAFIKESGTATTAEINAHWRAEGRGGVANNAIVRLLKRGELVRELSPGSRSGLYRCGDATNEHRSLAVTPHHLGNSEQLSGS